jgi:RNA polymerase sigma-70 factor (ECF subfamily)
MGQYNGVSDSELAELANGGEPDAFDELVKRYHRRVYGIASGILKDHDAADDVCQEAFIRAHKALRRFRKGANFYTWIYRITVNLSLNWIRDHKRLVRMDDAPVVATMSSGSQEDHAQQKELIDRVNVALDKVHPKYRIALLLRVNDGLSYAEISEVLGIPKGTVMSRISRARESLKSLLE